MQIDLYKPKSIPTPNTGLGVGVKARSHAEKNTAALFSAGASNASTKAYETGESSPLSHFLKAAAGTVLSQGLGKGASVSTPPLKTAVALTEEEFMIPSQPSLERQNARKDAMNALINKLGINGQVTEIGGETSPQSYTTYYVETQGNEKNLFILELENGEFIYAQTDEDPHQLTLSFDLARAGLGTNAGVADLKNAFATFFGAEEVKDLFSTYAASFDPKKLEDIFFEFWDATKDKEKEREESLA